MKRHISLTLLALSLTAPFANAALLSFTENFEGNLSAWTDRNPGDPESVIVSDPLRPGNHVLSFTRVGSGGSIFTTDVIQASASSSYTVTFEYLGLPTPADNDGDLGGFFGISNNLSPSIYGTDHYWVAGTGTFPSPIHLVDDGQWHSYTLTFTSPINTPVHLIFEDYNGSGSVAGDVYFDNIVFGVPEPSAAGFAGLAAALMMARRRARLG